MAIDAVWAMTMGEQSNGAKHQSDMRFLVDKNADGIIVVNEEGWVLFANPAAEQIFDRSSKALLGSVIGIPAIAGETADIVIHRPDGKKVDVEIRAVDTLWDDQPALLVSLRDVSARRALEEHLRHSAKMEAVGRLTAGIAHDFNNLLTVVIGNLEMARRQINEDIPIAKPLDNAMHGAKRAALLTERLLAFARRKPLAPRPFDANTLVAGMSDLLHRTLGENIAIQTDSASGLLAVEADPTELEAAILNLAVNARDAMPDGGALTIKTKTEYLDAAPEIAAGPYVSISVSDTGVGMDADVLAQVFEPFFTTKRDGQGTGLGLSHVYGFVRQSGGHVKIESHPGAGTAVRIYLPKLPESTPISRIEPAPAMERLPHGDGQIVLVVEDNEAVRAYTAACLRDSDYRVLEANDGTSALAMLEAEPDIRLLLTDLGLPGGMDGQAIAKSAQEMYPTISVLLMTAYAGASLVHGGRLDPGIELLDKPFTPAALAIRVHRLLHQIARPLRILVAEDEPMVRMYLVDILNEFGCEVEEAGTGSEALSKYHSLSEQLDAAIVDLGLPDFRGDTVIASVRESNRDLPIILATGYAGTALSDRFKSDTRLQILAKPFEAGQVRKALQSLGLESKIISAANSQKSKG